MDIKDLIGIDAISLKNTNFTKWDKSKVSPYISSIMEEDVFSNDPSLISLIDISTGEISQISHLKLWTAQEMMYPGLNYIEFKKVNVAQHNIISNFNCIHATLPTVINGNNIKNVSTQKELEESISTVQSNLIDLGFLDIDLLDSEIHNIELNTNIYLNKPFEFYKPCLDFIFNNMNKKGKLPYENGFKLSFTNFDICLYDKKEQLNECKNTYIYEDVLRIEITFKNLNRYTRLEEIDNVQDLIFNNGLDLLKEEFIRILDHYIYRPSMKALEKNRLKTINYITEGKKLKGLTSITNPLLQGNELFDIQILMEALRETESPSNYAKQYKKAVQIASTVDDITVLFGNLTNLNELFYNLNFNIYEPNLTKAAKRYIYKKELYIYSIINS